MTRQLYSTPPPAPYFTRNRRISPRQVEMLESLWNARLRREARRPRPERSREERFLHIAETVGRSVENAGDLSWREANRVLRRLLDELRSEARSHGLLPAPVGPVAAPAASEPFAAPRRRALTRPPKRSASSSGSARSKSVAPVHPQEHSDKRPALLRRGNARRPAKSPRKGGQGSL
jgi:hypothetical protein